MIIQTLNPIPRRRWVTLTAYVHEPDPMLPFQAPPRPAILVCPGGWKRRGKRRRRRRLMKDREGMTAFAAAIPSFFGTVKFLEPFCRTYLTNTGMADMVHEA